MTAVRNARGTVFLFFRNCLEKGTFFLFRPPEFFFPGAQRASCFPAPRAPGWMGKGGHEVDMAAKVKVWLYFRLGQAQLSALHFFLQACPVCGFCGIPTGHACKVEFCFSCLLRGLTKLPGTRTVPCLGSPRRPAAVRGGFRLPTFPVLVEQQATPFVF